MAKWLTFLVLGLLLVTIMVTSIIIIGPGIKEALQRRSYNPSFTLPTPTATPTPEFSTSLSLDSREFGYGGKIPTKYTCDGENLSPPLNIKNIPSLTRSLVLVVEDPDAPGGAFTHWTVWNIPATTTEIEEGRVPPGAVEGISYTGPCPPSGEHRYLFKLYAVSILVDLPAGASRQDLEKAILGKSFSASEFMGVYSR